jgi:hypothetical protein
MKHTYGPVRPVTEIASAVFHLLRSSDTGYGLDQESGYGLDQESGYGLDQESGYGLDQEPQRKKTPGK